MIKNKKIISFVLVLSILLSFPFAVSAEDEIAAVAENNFTEQGELLFKLEIASKPETDMPWSEISVTKAQFINMCVNAATGCNIPDTKAQLPYDDVYEGHTYISAISYAYHNGIIKSAEKLEPDSALTVDFALNTVVNALGFSLVSKYSADWQRYFKSRDILSGVNTSKKELSMNDAIMIVYNMLGMNTIEISGINGSSGAYAFNVIQGDVLAYSRFNLEIINGRVNATGLASILGEPLSEGSVNIGGQVYNCDKYEFLSYIGRYVDAYVDENGYVVHVVKTGNDDIMEIAADDFVDFDGNKITYANKNGKTRSQSVNSPTIVVNYGDVPAGKYSKDLFDFSEGKITLIGKDGNYDLVLIESAKSFVIGGVVTDDSGKTEVYSSNILGESITLDDGEYLKVSDSKGNETTVDALEAGSLITYKTSLDGRYADVVISKNIVNTTNVSYEYQDGRLSYVTLDNIEYSVNREVSSGKVDVSKGGAYSWYITPSGNVGAVDFYDPEIENYGFLLKAATEGGLSDDTKFKIINNNYYDNSNSLIINGAKKVKVDGTSLKGNSIIDAIKAFNGTTAVPVIYKLNENGEIYYIDTPNYVKEKESEYTLRERVFPSREIENGIFAKRQSTSYKNQFGALYIVPLSGVIINVTTDNSDAFTVEYLKEDRYPADVLKVYTKGEETYVTKLAVYTTDAGKTESTSYEKKYYIVEDIVRALNSESQDITRLYLRDGSKDVVYDTNPEINLTALSDLSLGDIVRISLDTRGNINGLEITLSYEQNQNDVFKTSNSSNYNLENRFCFGKVVSVDYDKELGMYVVAYYINDPTDIETVFVSAGDFNSVEKKRRGEIQISTVSPSTVKTYKYFGTNADNIMIRTVWMLCDQMYIFPK